MARLIMVLLLVAGAVVAYFSGTLIPFALLLPGAVIIGLTVYDTWRANREEDA